MFLKIITRVVQALSWAVYLMIFAVVLAALPIVAGYRNLVVLSGSMEPVYPVGSIIYYKAADFDDIAVGDVITYRLDEEAFATHRVVQKNEQEQSFITKGDNNESQDAFPVLYSRVAGKNTNLAIPYAGFAISRLANVFSIVSMAAILLLRVLLQTEKEAKQEEIN